MTDTQLQKFQDLRGAVFIFYLIYDILNCLFVVFLIWFISGKGTIQTRCYNYFLEKFDSNDRSDKAALFKHYYKDHINIIKTNQNYLIVFK